MAVQVSFVPSVTFIVDFLLQNAKKKLKHSISPDMHSPPNKSFVIREVISP